MRYQEILEACWKGYHKEGNKKMFGKTYPNCVKNKKKNEDVAEGKRVARKPGQPADSKKHSDLYTDENPKGTITGLKFATVEDARASVSKIRASGRSHAHKIQAAVAMEQRARAAGKASAAAVYRRYINANKKTNEQQLDEKCWDGYRQAGMKDKGGRQVPNCVPVEEVKSGPEITGKDLLFKAAAMAMRDASQEGQSLDYEQAIKQASRIYGIPYQPSELPRLLAQRAEIDRQLALLKQGKQVAKQRRQQKLAPTPAGAEEYWKTHALPTDRIKPATKSLEETEAELAEDLKKWFKEKWVRFGPDGKIRGDCARGSSKEGKPKCLPQSKAHALGKKGRAASAAKKRREDPNPERRGAAKNVATKVKEGAVADALRDYLQVTGNSDVDAVKNAIQKIGRDASLKPNAKARLLGQIGTMIKTHKLPIGREYYQYIQQFMEDQLDEKQDACYRKVKSRYKVWPSAYASGALVQCRKKGAANWGNKGKK